MNARLATHELDAAIADERPEWEDTRTPGQIEADLRAAYCEVYDPQEPTQIAPIDEFPPLNWKTGLFSVAVLVGLIGYFVLTKAGVK